MVRAMKNKKAESNKGCDLRLQAEERLKDSGGAQVRSTKEEIDNLALVHELQVHQIELEMQNEELKRARLEAEDALMKYSDLYDFAPIGLFTIDVHGLIQELNLAGAALLGKERSKLLHVPFWLFVVPKYRSSFDDFCRKAFETCVKQTCELELIGTEGVAIYVRIEGTVAEDLPQSERMCRIAVIDITERKKAEEMMLKANEAALDAVRTKSEFLANMSHEIRSSHECSNRHDFPPLGRRSDTGPEGLCRDHSKLRRCSDDRHKRHPRLL